MSSAIVQQNYVVTSPAGLHMRPLTAFAQKAATFQCEINVARDGKYVDGKSAWEMMSMLALPGTVLLIQAVGSDARVAVESLVALFDEWCRIDTDAMNNPD